MELDNMQQRRAILADMFPDYDIDAILRSFTNNTIEQIADWVLSNPNSVQKKRQGMKRRHIEEDLREASPEQEESDVEFDDLEDGLVLDRLTKELLVKFKKEMALPPVSADAVRNMKSFILGLFPTLRADFIRETWKATGNRVCATLITCFFVSNKLPERIQDVLVTERQVMWLMADPLVNKRKPLSYDIFNDELSVRSLLPQEVITDVLRFVDIMNTFTEKYCNILSRIKLLPEASTMKLEFPEEIDKFTCVVCFMDYGTTKRIMCGNSETPDSERHSFCRKCVRAHATAASEDMPLADGGIGLKCMEYKCTHPIVYSSVRRLIRKDIRRRIDERILEENLGQAGLNLERCRDCNFAVELEQSKEENKVFVCPNCGKDWCRHCEREWSGEHFGISCAELDAKQNIDNRQRELDKKLNDAVVRRCHKCNLQFVKSDGCNKMTCRCGATQCYICRATNISYKHFCQHPRMPGTAPNCQCTKKCTLWTDANKVDDEEIARIRAEMDLPGPSNAPLVPPKPSEPANLQMRPKLRLIDLRVPRKLNVNNPNYTYDFFGGNVQRGTYPRVYDAFVAAEGPLERPPARAAFRGNGPPPAINQQLNGLNPYQMGPPQAMHQHPIPREQPRINLQPHIHHPVHQPDVREPQRVHLPLHHQQPYYVNIHGQERMQLQAPIYQHHDFNVQTYRPYVRQAARAPKQLLRVRERQYAEDEILPIVHVAPANRGNDANAQRDGFVNEELRRFQQIADNVQRGAEPEAQANAYEYDLDIAAAYVQEQTAEPAAAVNVIPAPAMEAVPEQALIPMPQPMPAAVKCEPHQIEEPRQLVEHAEEDHAERRRDERAVDLFNLAGNVPEPRELHTEVVGADNFRRNGSQLTKRMRRIQDAGERFDVFPVDIRGIEHCLTDVYDDHDFWLGFSGNLNQTVNAFSQGFNNQHVADMTPEQTAAVRDLCQQFGEMHNVLQEHRNRIAETWGNLQTLFR